MTTLPVFFTEFKTVSSSKGLSVIKSITSQSDLKRRYLGAEAAITRGLVRYDHPSRLFHGIQNSLFVKGLERHQIYYLAIRSETPLSRRRGRNNPWPRAL